MKRESGASRLTGLPPAFDVDNYPSYQGTSLIQRQEIWSQYKNWKRMENTTAILMNDSVYSYVQEQLNTIYREYISKFSSTALSEEDCFV